MQRLADDAVPHDLADAVVAVWDFSKDITTERVTDMSAKDNFHLKGPGLSKKTSVAKRSKATWKVTLRKGKYTYFSDAHTKLKRSFSVK
jgi:hypothetical protein